MSDLAVAGARGGAANLAAQMISVLARALSIVILARLLTPDIFGLVAIVYGITSFASAIVLFGLPIAALQSDNLTRRAHSSLFFSNVTLGVLIAGALYLAAGPIGDIYGDPRLVSITHWLALVPLASGLFAQSNTILLRRLRFTTVSMVEVTAFLGGTGLAIAGALLGLTWEAVVLQNVAPVVIQAVLIIALARWVPGIPGAWQEVRQLVVIGANVFGTNVLSSVGRYLLVPIMGLSVASAPLGAFDRAQQLAVVPINATVNRMQRVAVPILTRVRAEPKRLLAYMHRAQLVVSYLTAPAFLVLAAIGTPFLVLLLGEDWLTAGQVIEILAVGSVFRALAQTVQWLFFGAGATRAGLLFNLWSQPAILVISLAGLPWGVVGVAVGNTIAWTLYWPIASVAASRAIGLPRGALIGDPLRCILQFALPIGLAAAAARWLVPGSDLLRVVLGIAAGAAVAMLLAFVVPSVRADLRVMKDTALLAVKRRRPR